MSDFKLIAIRPLVGCDPKFRKVLEPDKVYKFYNDYEFFHVDQDEKKPVEFIEYKSSTPFDLYSIKRPKGDPLIINVSAIVGKNGSGKSTLLELFFVTVYNLAYDKKILEFIINGKGEKEYLVKAKGIKVEIYYSFNTDIYCLKIDGEDEISFKSIKCLDKETKQEFNEISTKRDLKIAGLLDSNTELLRDFFFYSIAINYSFYGLNSDLAGNWIKGLFHKNDGYQTPVVISPYREEGNLDINTEIYLAKQRLLSNILKPVLNGNDFHLNLTEYQKVTSITFKLSKSKIEYAYKKGPLEEDAIKFSDFYKDNKRESLLREIYFVFFDSKEPSRDIKYKVEVEDYIIKKLIKIARTYKTYDKFFSPDLIIPEGIIGSTENKAIKLESNFGRIKQDFKNYLIKLNTDNSHITFKLRQAINYLKSNLLRNDVRENVIWRKFQDDNDDEFETLQISVKQLSNRIIDSKIEQTELINFIPPSLFDIEIHLLDKDEKGVQTESTFSGLSSGEQQLIHAVQGILYQINNVNSVFHDHSDGKEKITYRYINILLDEIELYFHPELQKNFIDFLLTSLKSLNVPNIKGINILFSTHSPFILSDIPSSNILKLKVINGQSEICNNKELTFGANIHELLANDFFLTNGFMGKWAQKKINSSILFMENKINPVKEFKDEDGWERNSLNIFINNIGEPLIRNSLRELFNKAFIDNNRTEIKKEIDRLSKILNQT